MTYVWTQEAIQQTMPCHIRWHMHALQLWSRQINKGSLDRMDEFFLYPVPFKNKHFLNFSSCLVTGINMRNITETPKVSQNMSGPGKPPTLKFFSSENSTLGVKLHIKHTWKALLDQTRGSNSPASFISQWPTKASGNIQYESCILVPFPVSGIPSLSTF